MIYAAVFVLAFAIWPPLFDPTSLPRSILLAIIGIYVYVKYSKDSLPKRYIIFGILFFSILSLSTLLNKVDIVSYLFAEPGRAFGMISYSGLFLIAITLVAVKLVDFAKLRFYFYITLIALNLYGLIQIVGKDPISWQTSYPGISLTFGNPNFASAAIGILVSFPINDVSKLLFRQKKSEISKIVQNILLILISLFVIFKTYSIQGFALCALIIFISVFKNLSISKLRKNVRFLFTLGLILSVTTFLIGSSIFDYFIKAGSVYQRISYYSQVMSIGMDNFFRGVGFGNLTYFSASYRTPQFVLQEGPGRYLDRSHNVLLDFFVNHGIFGFIIWIVFLIVVSKKSIEVLRNPAKDFVHPFVGMWFAYLLQSLISPDHIFLLFIGVFSAGIILREASPKKLIMEKRNLNSFILSSISIFLFVLSIPTSIQVLRNDYIARNAVVRNVISLDEYNYILKTRSLPSSIEQVAFSLYLNKELLPKIVDRFVEIVPKRSQAWYLRAIVSEREGDLDSARKYMARASSLDPLNPGILLGLGLFDIRTGNVQEAIKILGTLRLVAPGTPGISNLANEIEEKLG